MNTQVDDKPVLVDEDIILAQTHQHRTKMFQGIMVKDGEFKVPEDPAVAKVAVSLLKDMDAAALGRKRIKVDERAVDAGAGAAALIAKVLTAAAGAKPYLAQAPVARDAPVLGSEVPTPPMVEGEMAVVGGASETYEAFVARTAGNGASVPGSST